MSTQEKENKAELAQLYANMGLEYLRNKKYEAAENRLLKSIESNPDYAPAHHYLAQVYSRLDNMQQAQRHYDRALELDATDPFLQNNYAVFLCNTGKIDDAEQWFLKLSENVNYSVPHLLFENLGNCVYRGTSPAQQIRAESYFKRALAYNPKLKVSLSRMAEINFKKGDYFKARAYLERFMAFETYTPEMLLLGVKTEKQLGDHKMMEYYKDLLSERFGRSMQAKEALRIE
ncbi:MAG: type IV pilus biogenesis/stability protein PilW [Gammaproteobacteria bacterium]|nr:type IV pilus biogenesis/stability protein PilW [Gammaproteobacteria bacterium]